MRMLAAEAANAIESALKQMAVDAWPLEPIKTLTIAHAQRIGMESPALARRMLAALSRPLAAGDFPEARLDAALRLARVAGLADTCRGVVEALEPHVPWNQTTLLVRRDCYAATHDDRLRAAEQDLVTFGAAETWPFSVGLIASAR